MDKMNDLCALLTMDDIEEKSAKTKRALLPSIIAVIVCIAMLAGTTLAWFTDTTSSGLNQIRSGNLDVAVQYTLDGEEWKDLEGATDLFGGEGALFEPGYTRVVAFKIINNGGVALKYKVGMNVASETKGTNKAGEKFSLSDYLKVKTAVPEDAEALATAFASRGDGERLDWKEYNFNELVIDAAGTINAGTADVNYYVMKVYMPETVDNVANANSKDNTASISFGVDVVATQAPVESDSYDEKYDENAAYSVTAKQWANSFKDGATVTVDSPTAIDGLLDTTTGKVDSNSEPMLKNAGEVTLNLKNTVTSGNLSGNTWGVMRVMSGTTLTITGDENGKFINTKSNSIINVCGGKVIVESGYFESNSAIFFYYTDGDDFISGMSLAIKGGTFKAEEDVIYNPASLPTNITITGGTFYGWDPSAYVDTASYNVTGNDGVYTVTAK